MERYSIRLPYHVEGRKQPAGYTCQFSSRDSSPSKTLYVVGHYETACGGGDTMKGTDDVFDAVRRWADSNFDVIFEGIISQDDVLRTVELHRRHKLKVIALRVPIEDCLAGIQARRDARNDERPLNPRNTVERAKRLQGIVSRLRDAGVDCNWMNREQALATAMEALGLGNDYYSNGQPRVGEVHASQQDS